MKQQQSTGFSCDRTAAFSGLRGQHLRRSPGYGSALIEDDSSARFNLGYNGQFLDASTRISGSLSTLSSEIDAYAASQNRVFRATFDSSKGDESRLKDQAKTISSMLRRAVSDTEAIGRLSASLPAHIQFFARNLERAYKAKIQDLALAFRQLQCDYYMRLKEQEENDDIDDVDPFSMPFTNDQVMQIQENDYAIDHENQELTEILESFRNILELSDALKSSVFQQGTILDRIDSNVQETNELMEEAVTALEKAETHQKSGMKCMYAYLLCMLILTIILGSVIIVKKKRKEKKNSGGEEKAAALLAEGILSFLMN